MDHMKFIFVYFKSTKAKKHTLRLFLSSCVSLLSHINKNIRFKLNFKNPYDFIYSIMQYQTANWFFSSLLTTLKFFFYQMRANVKWKWRKSKIIFHEVFVLQRKNEGSQRCDLCRALGTGMRAVACTHW